MVEPSLLLLDKETFVSHNIIYAHIAAGKTAALNNTTLNLCRRMSMNISNLI